MNTCVCSLESAESSSWVPVSPVESSIRFDWIDRQDKQVQISAFWRSSAQYWYDSCKPCRVYCMPIRYCINLVIIHFANKCSTTFIASNSSNITIHCGCTLHALWIIIQYSHQGSVWAGPERCPVCWLRLAQRLVVCWVLWVPVRTAAARGSPVYSCSCPPPWVRNHPYRYTGGETRIQTQYSK